ncbi:NAD(P)-dependent alcohol dehydrogenase [Arthrobacter sp. H5]|uniref:NAD(P)-dependent alcohol dehydrogenase n=1 Tax=Arthrobacter sp. H5 TaxID=1267973 RepID=UPI0004B33289|nr:NAD(P)-dependent alcohol dehydrogenase [Arthrobacter sp. H5]
MNQSEKKNIMKVAAYRHFGSPEVVSLVELPKPSPGRDHVLVKVHASTVSAADYRARSRNVPKGLGILAAFGLGIFRPHNPILGMDVAGVVEAVGANVTTFKPGDEVIAMLGAKFGGHAGYVCVPQKGAITVKPRNMSFEEAVTLVFGGLTALGFLNRAALKPGGTILVNGASGAVGTAATQLAQHMGAHVTGVCSSANRELVSSLGADRVIDYAEQDFTTEGRTYDVIIDCVGNAPFERVEALINPGGTLLLVIADLKEIVRAAGRSRKSGKLVTAGNIKYTAEDLAFLVSLAESGRYKAVTDRTYRLSDIVEAHRYVETGRKTGNVVVQIAAGSPGPDLATVSAHPYTPSP